MKFASKMLKKAAEGAVVYVLMESEKPIIPGVNEGTPVAVVTSEQQANTFMAQNKKRNWFRFTLDELPENLQPLPPEPPPDERVRKIDETRRDVERTTQEMQEFLKNLKRKRK